VRKAWGFSLDGHVFYVLNDVDGSTYVCDLTTGQWHHWYTGDEPGLWNAWRGIMWRGHALAGGEEGNRIWLIDPDAETDEGEHQISRVVTAFAPLRGKASIRQGSLRVNASIGSPSADPAVLYLRFSDDEGTAWSHAYERTLEPDKFDQVLRYRSLGRIRAPGRIWELADKGGLVRIDGVDSDIETR
jgi:hypothetical protein